jgi:hypothetical protein
MDQTGRRVLNYCYVDAETRTNVREKFEQGIELWMDALGGPAGPSTGHNLAITEVTKSGTPQLCYQDFDYAEWRGSHSTKAGTPNPNIEQNVLFIYVDEERLDEFASATNAYKEARKWGDSDIWFAKDPYPAKIAHEVRLANILVS